MKGGWFHTGDVATIDREQLHSDCRPQERDHRQRGREHIFAGSGEGAASHPAVYEAVVIPVPDEKWGEVPKALVVLKPGAQPTRPNFGVLPCPAVALQVSALGRISRKPAQDRHRQALETRAAAKILDGTESNCLVTLASGSVSNQEFIATIFVRGEIWLRLQQCPTTKISGGSFLIEERRARRCFHSGRFHRAALSDRANGRRIRQQGNRSQYRTDGAQGVLRHSRTGEEGRRTGTERRGYSRAYGGMQMDKVTSAIIADRLAKYGGFSTTWGAHTCIGTLPIVYFGTEEQKKKYLPGLASGEMVGAYALSESSSGVRCSQLPHPGHAFRRRQALPPERRKNVDHQRRVRRPVHRVRQSERREVHRLPRSSAISLAFRWARKNTRWAFAARPPVR